MTDYICRLCLETIKANIPPLLDVETGKYLLNIVFPNMDMSITKDIELCHNCANHLKLSYNIVQKFMLCYNGIRLQTFIKEEEMDSYEPVNGNKKFCWICKKNDAGDLMELNDNGSTQVYEDMCREVFNLRMTSENNKICSRCLADLKTAYNFKLRSIKIEEKIQAYCKEQGTYVLQNEDLQLIANTFEDTECKEIFVKEEVEISNVLDDEKDFVSEFEVKSFGVKNELIEDGEQEEVDMDVQNEKVQTHEQKIPELNQSIDKNGDTIYECYHCSMKTRWKGDLSKHMLVHRPKETVPLFLCPSCPFTTKRRATLKNHKLTHTKSSELPKFKCPLCPYQGIRKGNLTQHMYIHDKEKKLECTQCSYRTNRSRDLTRHVATVHEKQPSYKCDKCKYATKRKDSLTYHMSKHSNTKTVYECSLCPFKSKAKKYFGKHVRNCHKEDEIK